MSLYAQLLGPNAVRANQDLPAGASEYRALIARDDVQWADVCERSYLFKLLPQVFHIPAIKQFRYFRVDCKVDRMDN